MPASAAFVQVYGGPTYDQATHTGYRFVSLPPSNSIVGNGVGIGIVSKVSGGTFLGSRAFRWDASGADAMELGNLSTTSDGNADSAAFAMNSSGTIVGYSSRFSVGLNIGRRAVRWDASGTTATELGASFSEGLGLGISDSTALAINAAGTIVGQAQKTKEGGFDFGPRPVRWDVGSTAPTELGNLGTFHDFAAGSARAINTSGVIVGSSTKYGFDSYFGERAVRWDASGTTATELGNLGVDGLGYTLSVAVAINDAGSAAGYAEKYTGGTSRGYRAVRWDASGTAATELGNLGTDSVGNSVSIANAINDAGIVVGYAQKYTDGRDRSFRAVRWDPSGRATELGNLGTTRDGVADSRAFAINSAGTAVGFAQKFVGGADQSIRAVLWNADALAIDLNTLIDPKSGWTLLEAHGISDTNWVSGIGAFDADGNGPLPAYDRAFLMNVSSVVPEPASVGLFTCASTLLILRCRHNQSN
jgi:hypothetical protein